jgi:hypothetical protein
MENEYDFSKAERGKFYKKDIELSIPVYLDKDVMAFVGKIAEKKQKDVSFVVNQLIHSGMELAEIMK